MGTVDVGVILLLLIGGIAVYIAYRDPRMGAAIAVGVAVISVLYLLLKK